MFNPKIIIPIAAITLYVAIASFLYVNPSVNISTIIANGSYTLTIRSCGCFGCSTSTLHIINNNIAKYSFKKYNPATQLFENITKTINWNKQKEQLLRQFFVDGTARRNEYGCTTETEYSLRAVVFSTSFTDGGCKYERQLNDIIGIKNMD